MVLVKDLFFKIEVILARNLELFNLEKAPERPFSGSFVLKGSL